MAKGVLHLDGSSITIVGVFENMNMALHACPGCTVTQEILVVELPPHFAIFLSRDFIAQISGYIAFDWS